MARSPQSRQTFDIGSTGFDQTVPSTAGQQIAANWRLTWAPQMWERTRQQWMEKDPNFDPWGSLDGYEEFADRLLEAESQAQSDAIKAQIDRNRRDQLIDARGPMNGFVTGLLTGVADPLNLIPIPAVKGIGMLKGALTFGAANTAIGAVAEAGRQWGDPTARPSEAIANITLSGLIGAGIGAPVGAWGARGRAAALSRLDAGLGVIEDPGASIDIRGFDEDFKVKDERPRPNPDGTQPRFTMTDEFVGYEVKELNGVRYAYDDGFGWVNANELGTQAPTQVIDPVLLAELDAPVRTTQRTLRRYDIDIRREYADAAWHDEMQGYIDDPDVNVETVIRSEKDLINYRTREFLWQREHPIGPNETVPEWRQRVGKQAMAEHRASQVKGGYAGPKAVAFLLEHGNFSPLAKAIRVFKGDNVLADTFTRLVGDYGWAQKSAEFGHAAPPSVLLQGMQHNVKFFEWQTVLDQEFLRFVSGDQGAKGATFQRANVSAAGYAFKQGIRRKMGRDVMTKDIFIEMVSKAVFDDTAFTHKGFPVNQNVRNAAVALSNLLDEYEELQRAVGLFKDQRTLTKDVKYWSKQKIHYQHRMNVWLWGQSAQPATYNAVITVHLPAAGRALPGQTGQANMMFMGTNHEDAVEAMIDALGDVGFDLADQLTPANYGYVDSILANPTIADFIDMDTMNSQRVAGLSPRQKLIYDDMKGSLDIAEANLAASELQLQTATDHPHTFTTAGGRRENYFTRYWLSSKIADEQDKFTFLLTKWFEVDGNPLGAEARAAETTEKIVMGEAGGAANRGHPGHLNARALNIPNSFSVTHPQWGEIKVSDFIDLNALAVVEHYIRSSGTRIELAKMFGDVNLQAERARIRQYLMDEYYAKQTTDAGRADIKLKMKEIDDYLDLHLDALLGTMRDSSPWRLDNRTANTALQLTSMALMGKVVLTTTADAMHSAMAAGFGTYFRAVFTRMFDDLESVAPGANKVNLLVGELFDTARTRYTMMAHQMENGRPVVGGTWLENFIARRMPGYFKINGLTPVTMWLKELMGLAAQHNVMADAIRISQVVAAGEVPSKADSLRLAALGIDARNAALIASMPFDTRPNGLMLPAIDNWTGPNAKRARMALLRAVHAEMRRGVVTPSIGDRSTIFNGVLTKHGKKVAETDLMRIPMQFMGYGVAAHNKVLTSMIQGRDRDRVMGLFFMLGAGIVSTYLRSDSASWKRKSYDQIMFEGWENSGIGGFWFGDLNRQIEKVSNNRIGLRPSLGIKPGFKYDTDMQAIIAGLGAAPSVANDLRRAFMDTEIGGSRRASMVRRALPYNNILWWDRVGKDFTSEAVELVGASSRGGRE